MAGFKSSIVSWCLISLGSCVMIFGLPLSLLPQVPRAQVGRQDSRKLALDPLPTRWPVPKGDLRPGWEELRLARAPVNEANLTLAGRPCPGPADFRRCRCRWQNIQVCELDHSLEVRKGRPEARRVDSRVARRDLGECGRWDPGYRQYCADQQRRFSACARV